MKKAVALFLLSWLWLCEYGRHPCYEIENRQEPGEEIAVKEYSALSGQAPLGTWILTSGGGIHLRIPDCSICGSPVIPCSACFIKRQAGYLKFNGRWLS